MRGVLVLFLIVGLACFAEDADAVYQQGLTKLRQSQSDQTALVPTTKLLAQAAALYEKMGEETKSAEVNSCLYWAKKKMTLADTNAFKGNLEVTKRLEATAKAVPVSEAQKMLERADAFAQGHADDPLLIAIHYFEIADRFKDNDTGRKAMDLSLKFMQQIGEKAKLAAYKPAATDGKAFITSEPPGAAIILVNADGKQDLGKKTPSLIQIPMDRQTLELQLTGMKVATLRVNVDGKTIAKPTAVKLEPITVTVDIIFEEGWQVFIDGKPVDAHGASKAKTPCTADLPLGRHELGLAKEGFADIKQMVEVVEGGVKKDGILDKSLEPKGKPIKGTGRLVADSRPLDGTWLLEYSNGHSKKIKIQSKMVVVVEASWECVGNKYTLLDKNGVLVAENTDKGCSEIYYIDADGNMTVKRYESNADYIKGKVGATATGKMIIFPNKP